MLVHQSLRGLTAPVSLNHKVPRQQQEEVEDCTKEDHRYVQVLSETFSINKISWFEFLSFKGASVVLQ